MLKVIRLLATTAAVLAALSPASLLAESTEAGTSGRTFAGVNGTEIRCPVPALPGPEQLASQFDTAPRDLDQLSREALAFFSVDSQIGAAFRAKRDEQFANDWPFLCRYRDANADLIESGHHPRVVFMGDSITEGWILANPQFFQKGDFADRGISGQSSSQMVARFQQDVVSLRPKAVHIMAGTNDIGGATGPVTEEEFLGNITAMIDMAKSNGISVVLGAIPPMSRLLPRPDFDTRPVVVRLNARLAALAKGKNVGFVDYYSPLAMPDGAFDPAYANDGVHPTRAGYAIMEPLAQQALDAALSK